MATTAVTSSGSHRHLLPPPARRVAPRRERGGRAARHELVTLTCSTFTHVRRAALTHSACRVGVPVVRVPVSPPPSTPSDLARRSNTRVPKAFGGLSPSRSILPPQGGGKNRRPRHA